MGEGFDKRDKMPMEGAITDLDWSKVALNKPRRCKFRRGEPMGVVPPAPPPSPAVSRHCLALMTTDICSPIEPLPREHKMMRASSTPNSCVEGDDTSFDCSRIAPLSETAAKALGITHYDPKKKQFNLNDDGTKTMGQCVESKEIMTCVELFKTLTIADTTGDSKMQDDMSEINFTAPF